MGHKADPVGPPAHGGGHRTAQAGRHAGRLVLRLAPPALGAGLIFALALASQGTVAPGKTSQVTAPVTAVVRNDLGQLKWVATQAADYTSLEAAGRRLYVEARCAYCHSQYTEPRPDPANRWSPISQDERRWGPGVEPGEYAYDDPVLFGARGIAPDLARVGLKYGDEWHLAHFYNPSSVVKRSIMGGFAGLFDAPGEPVRIVPAAIALPAEASASPDAASDPAAETGKAVAMNTLERTPATEKLFDFDSKDQVKLTPTEAGLMFVPLTARGRYPLVWAPNGEFSGAAVTLVAETEAIHALTAYVQKLGTDRGRWRELAEPAQVEGARLTVARSDEAIALGKQVYERRCIGCHGVKGDGNGEAATFMHRQRPRNFTTGVFKFRQTKGTLPTDADLLRTITRGIRGTAMPAWFELPLEERLAVIQYIKYELSADRADPQKPYLYFVEEAPPPAIEIGAPPQATPELIAHGKEIWLQAKCWECHGRTGKGDGEKAAGLKDDWGFPIPPANLTRGQFKSGPTVSDLYRTITLGLSGTPMASFEQSFPDADRWALSYYIQSLSAFTHPLTAAPLPLTEADRDALNDPRLVTSGPAQAYRLTRPFATAKDAASVSAQATGSLREGPQ